MSVGRMRHAEVCWGEMRCHENAQSLRDLKDGFVLIDVPKLSSIKNFLPMQI